MEAQLKTQDLRIGNLVTIDNPNAWLKLKDIPLIVTGVNNLITEDEKKMFPHSDGKVWMKGEYETYGQFSQFVSPIPLTEEWMLKFGFENSYRSDFTVTMQHATNDKFGIKINVSTGMSLVYLGIPIRIEFVHQLQNLYFALTGEELTIKEKSCEEK